MKLRIKPHAPEQLPAQKNYLRLFLTAEERVMKRTGIARERLRADVSSRFNIQWLAPHQRALYTLKNPEPLIFLQLFFESMVLALTEPLGSRLQQHLRGLPSDSVARTITLNTTGFQDMEQKIFADETAAQRAAAQIPEIIQDLRMFSEEQLGQDAEAIFKEVYADIHSKYAGLPGFADAVRALPKGFLEQQKRTLLYPEAASAASIVAAAFSAAGESSKSFLTRNDEVNRLPPEQQVAEFLQLYLDLEASLPVSMSHEKLRDAVQKQVPAAELPRAFQLVFMDAPHRLLILTEDFIDAFITISGLGEKMDAAASKATARRRIPHLSRFIDDTGTIAQTKIANDAEHLLTEALPDYIGFFYNKAVEFLGTESARTSLREAYSQLQRTYYGLSAHIFHLLPEAILPPAERAMMVGDSFKEMAQIVLAGVPDTLQKPLTVSYTKLAGQAENADNESALIIEYAKFFDAVAEAMHSALGTTQTAALFEHAYHAVKRAFSTFPIFTQILKAIPSGILETEKFAMMSREQLASVSRSLRRTETMKSEFANIAAHELKTPLVPLKGYLQMMYAEPARYGLTKKAREYIAICLHSVDREEKLVQDILDISKLEAGEMKFSMEDVNILPILKSSAENLAFLAKEKNIELKQEFPEQLPYVTADTLRISQVVGNLIDNAIKFTDTGSVTVSAKVAESRIQITVADTGRGMSSESISRLFSKFFQADVAATRTTRGTGLGLAICKEIILAHHGKIWVESDGPGKGSRFIFTLPLT